MGHDAKRAGRSNPDLEDRLEVQPVWPTVSMRARYGMASAGYLSFLIWTAARTMDTLTAQLRASGPYIGTTAAGLLVAVAVLLGVLLAAQEIRRIAWWKKMQAGEKDAGSCAVCGKTDPKWKPRRCGKCGLTLCRTHLPVRKHDCKSAPRRFGKKHGAILAIIFVSSLVMVTFLLLIPRQNIMRRCLSIYGNVVVWQENRSGNWDIYAYDIANRQMMRITSNPTAQTAPSIYDRTIVWLDERNGRTNVYVYDLTSKKQTPITANWTTPHVGETLAYQDIVAWISYPTGALSELYIHNLSTGNRTCISYGVSQYFVSMYRDIMVWTDSRQVGENEYWRDVYLYNLSTGQERQITSDWASQNSPHLYGDILVWAEENDIYIYNLSNSQKTRIADGAFSQGEPSIFGNMVVWQDHRKGNMDIYAYDLSARKERQITSDPSDQIQPVIYNNTIAWVDRRRGGWDIYIYDLSTNREGRITSTKVLT